MEGEGKGGEKTTRNKFLVTALLAAERFSDKYKIWVGYKPILYKF